jgi:putative aminopeptidase FrvX
MGIQMKKDTKQIKLHNFINESLKDRKAPHKWMRTGTIGTDAQKRIEQKCGVNVAEIHIDNSGIIHAMSKHQHNLDPDDLLHAVDVINTTNDLSLPVFER